MKKKMLNFALIVFLATLMSSCFYGGRPNYGYNQGYGQRYGYGNGYAPRPYIRIVPPPVIIAPRYGYGYQNQRGYGRSHYGRRGGRRW